MRFLSLLRMLHAADQPRSASAVASRYEELLTTWQFLWEA